MPEPKRVEFSDSVRFITFGCFRERPYLNQPGAKSILIRHINLARKKHGFKLLAYVFMPNHVHILIYPRKETHIGYLIREIKSKMARQFFSNQEKIPGSTRVFWKRRCFDRHCVNAAKIKNIIDYIHSNPIRKGLVRRLEDYKWSSYNWYRGRRNVPITIDDEFGVY